MTVDSRKSPHESSHSKASEPMAHLFEPLTLRGRTLRNRLGVSPMCMYSSADGFAGDWHLMHLGQYAAGGAGLVFTEAAAVSPEARISPADLGLWKDEHVEPLARVGRFVQAQGALVGVQLAHAGRKAATRVPWEGGGPLGDDEHPWPTVGPSALAFDPKYRAPVALDEAGLAKVVRDFGLATRRALAAGLDVVEVHAAHGYLLHQFLSPLSNTRTDRWGGTFENRTRLVREVVRAVREAWPEDRPLFVRVSATDWTPGGWDAEQTVELARALKALGVDAVDCSSGGNVATAQIPVAPGYQVGFAEQVRRGAGLATAAVGMITEPAQAEAVVAEGKADLVLLARELLRDPHFPLRAARVLGQTGSWARQYVRARG
jgi:2,4-dienoyl-CoA reductase-like NADH-dependent reductase (Old Yellow Enzyme family)